MAENITQAIAEILVRLETAQTTEQLRELTEADQELRKQPGYICGLYNCAVSHDLPVGVRTRAVAQLPKLIEVNWFLFEEDQKASDDPDFQMSSKFLKITAEERQHINDTIVPSIMQCDTRVVLRNLLYTIRYVGKRTIPKNPTAIISSLTEALTEAPNMEVFERAVSITREVIVGLTASVAPKILESVATHFPRLLKLITPHLDEAVHAASQGSVSLEAIQLMYSCYKMAAKVVRYQLTNEFNTIASLRPWVERALAIMTLQPPQEVCEAVSQYGMACVSHDPMAAAFIKAQKWVSRFLMRIIKRLKAAHERTRTINAYHEKINKEFGVAIAQQIVDVMGRAYQIHMHMLLPETYEMPENPYFLLPSIQRDLLDTLRKLMTLAAPYKMVLKENIELIIKGFIVYCCRLTPDQLELWQSDPTAFTAALVSLTDNDSVEWHASEVVNAFVKLRTEVAFPVIQAAVSEICSEYSQLLETPEYHALVEATANGADSLPEELVKFQERYHEACIRKTAIMRIMSFLSSRLSVYYEEMWGIYVDFFAYDMTAPCVSSFQLPRLCALEFVYAFAGQSKPFPNSELLPEIVTTVLENMKNPDLVIQGAACRAIHSLLLRKEVHPIIEGQFEEVLNIFFEILQTVKSQILGFTMRKLIVSFPQHVKTHAVKLGQIILEFFKASLISTQDDDADDETTEDAIWVVREYSKTLADLHMMVHDDPQLRYEFEQMLMPTILDSFTPPEQNEDGYYMESKEELIHECLPLLKQMVHEVNPIFPHTWEAFLPLIRVTMSGDLYDTADEVSSILLSYLDYYPIMVKDVPDSIESLAALYKHYLTDGQGDEEESKDHEPNEFTHNQQGDITAKIWITNVAQKLAGYLSADPAQLEGHESPEATAKRILDVSLSLIQSTVRALQVTRVPLYATSLLQVLSQLMIVNPIFTLHIFDSMNYTKVYFEHIATLLPFMQLTDDIRGIVLSMSTLLLAQERSPEVAQSLAGVEGFITDCMTNAMARLVERNEWVHDSDAEDEDEDEDEDDDDDLFLNIDENEDVVDEADDDDDDTPLAERVKAEAKSFSQYQWEGTPKSCGLTPVRFLDLGDMFMKAVEVAAAKGVSLRDDIDALREFAMHASQAHPQYVERRSQ